MPLCRSPANLAVAAALQAAHTGLFRVMAEPDALGGRAAAPHRARVRPRLARRRLARATSSAGSTRQAEGGRLHAADPPRRARRRPTSPGAKGEKPWHAAMAATYAHATAPLRRLADVYVVRAALAVANGEPVPDAVTEAFARLPEVMARAEALSGRIERAVIDLAEAVMLQGRVGETFDAIVTDLDERGARIQLRDLPVVARIDADGLQPGDVPRVRLARADPATRAIAFADRLTWPTSGSRSRSRTWEGCSPRIPYCR